VVARHGQVEVLVNNAGIARITPALDASDAEWRLIMDVNVNGVFWREWPASLEVVHP
jgi:galactitol 2-dehydrogenase (L-tagatose-forming)